MIFGTPNKKGPASAGPFRLCSLPSELPTGGPHVVGLQLGAVSGLMERTASLNGPTDRRDGGGGADIEMVLVDGGHTVPKGWAGWMADWFESEPAVR